MSQYVIIKFLMERILWFIYILWLGLTLFVIHVIFKISNRRRLLQFLKKKLQWCELATFKKQRETFEKCFNWNYILYLAAVLGKDFVLVFKLNGQMNNFYMYTGWVFSKKKIYQKVVSFAVIKLSSE